jgi:imidazole glycerol phosphate synthase glutamine amidotransferase subunit
MSAPRVTVVDYGMGNLRSVAKALESVGAGATVTRDPAEVKAAERLVLPGVGAFGKAVSNLEEAGLRDALLDFLARERPFLGICLGFQLLFESSEEDVGAEGLGFLKGTCRRFDEGLRIPHMGWNTLEWMRDSALRQGLPHEPYVYFVHSYYVVPADEGFVATETIYGVRFASAVRKGAVLGVQFHPEKSQDVGLRFLANVLKGV